MSEHRDPAIKAAITAMFTVKEPTVRATAIAAAREALAPIRDLHQPSDDECRCCRHCVECGSIGTGWPCATAKLIYPESELT